MNITAVVPARTGWLARFRAEDRARGELVFLGIAKKLAPQG